MLALAGASRSPSCSRSSWAPVVDRPGLGRGMGTGVRAGLFLWRLQVGWWAASAVYGALQALDIIIIVFGATLLMNHLEGSGAVATIRGHFTHITADRRVQVVLIGRGLVTLVAGAAGFGTPGRSPPPHDRAQISPVAAIFGLVFNAVQPPFGAAGTPGDRRDRRRHRRARAASCTTG